MIAEHVEAHAGLPLNLRRPSAGLRKVREHWLDFTRRSMGDIAAIVLLMVVSAALTLMSVVPVQSFLRGDWPVFFLPTYTFLGEQLRALNIPGWNPFQFAGTPFAGDPESGWTYLPAMLLYTLLPAEAATGAFIGAHLALASVANYSLARLLGIGVIGSFVAGSAFALAWVATASSHMAIFVQVAIWLVVALAGVELAARARSWPHQLWGWFLGGLGVSQILAAWLGQGAFYALIVICVWIAYRTLIVPFERSPMRPRVRNALITGAGVVGSGFLLSAAGLLPRLDAVARSSLAGGAYAPGSSAWADRQIGLTATGLVQEVLGGYTGSLWWYAGAAATALALMAPIVARRWPPMPFFSLLALASLVLALEATTPLHTALYALVPFFERLHVHYPERILILYPPAVALLAGATIAYLPKARNVLVLVTAAAVPVLVATGLYVLGDGEAIISLETTVMMLGASALVILFALLGSSRVRWRILLGLVVLVLWDPAGRIIRDGFADESRLEHSLPSSLAQDAGPFLYHNGAAAFLADAARETPGRYAGYDPALLDEASAFDRRAPDLGYRKALKNPNVNRLLVFNWGTWFGVEDVQGYNPIQIQRYVEYVDALNGHRQEYHERDLFPAGLASPLLDLLNMRYLIVPADAPERPDLAPLLTEFPLVYADAHVRILENLEALPRAWLVHEARQVAPGAALPLLAAGTVDPRQVALLEVAPPLLAPATDAATEAAVFTQATPDRIDLRVSAQAPALLVLSAVWDPGWTATVSGQPAPVYQANHALRAVPIPTGEHTVVLTYEPPLLRVGIVITVITLAFFLSAAVWPKMRHHSLRLAGRRRE